MCDDYMKSIDYLNLNLVDYNISDSELNLLKFLMDGNEYGYGSIPPMRFINIISIVRLSEIGLIKESSGESVNKTKISITQKGMLKVNVIRALRTINFKNIIISEDIINKDDERLLSYFEDGNVHSFANIDEYGFSHHTLRLMVMNENLVPIYNKEEDSFYYRISIRGLCNILIYRKMKNKKDNSVISRMIRKWAKNGSRNPKK